MMCDRLRNDILKAEARAELCRFVCASLPELEADEPRISALRRSLENQKPQALAFSYKLDEGIAEIAARFKIPEYPVRPAVELHTRKAGSKGYYALERAIYRQVHHYFYPVREAVGEFLKTIHRSSSPIENLCGRLRCYFFLRRHIGPDYLELLRFFLCHHPFMRSSHPEKIGKSPAELLTGEKHPHWLELLGFTLFRRSVELA